MKVLNSTAIQLHFTGVMVSETSPPILRLFGEALYFVQKCYSTSAFLSRTRSLSSTFHSIFYSKIQLRRQEEAGVRQVCSGIKEWE